MPVCHKSVFDLKIISSQESLRDEVINAQKNGQIIGFVPTMGALHEGHMALIRRAAQECDFVISSVFVNPTQFNNPSDLELYPRTPEKDAVLLQQNGCDLAFFPSVETIYPLDYAPIQLDLGFLDLVMEGEFRPGHFKGVVQVVHRLFELVSPSKAYFGLKDFQQVAVIQFMVKKLDLSVEIVPCSTLRESSGLAMSSRNVRLSADGLIKAVTIYNALISAKELSNSFSPSVVCAKITEYFEKSSLELEYFTIVNPQTLEVLTDQWVSGATACIAAFCEDVRLIDNMCLIPN